MEMSVGDIRTARTIFNDMIGINPDDVKTLQSWAVAEARIGDPERARLLFQRAISREPKNVKVWNAWGRMELSTGELTTPAPWKFEHHSFIHCAIE
jgi:Tfp pilus assembly protein PilF